MQFKDKVVWITGASSGIGEHLAYAFAGQGAKLALSARNEAELQRVRDNCPDGTDILLVPLDITDTNRVFEAARTIIQHYSFLNILINNAGISQRELAKDTDLDVDRRVLEVDYLGTVAVTKAVLPTLLRQQFGQIVVISSIMGKIGTPMRSAYAAAKHALHGFFDSLRAELHHDNIAVSIICPGFVHTNVTLNALRGNGQPNAVMAESTAAGLPPDVFARKAMRAIAARKAEVYIGGKEVLSVYLKRFAPGILRWLIRRVKVT